MEMPNNSNAASPQRHWRIHDGCLEIGTAEAGHGADAASHLPLFLLDADMVRARPAPVRKARPMSAIAQRRYRARPQDDGRTESDCRPIGIALR
jgi:hypothetical protein